MTSTCVWTGHSGKGYQYFVYPLPYKFNEGQKGNYVFAKIDNNQWAPLLIGQGDLSICVSDTYEQAALLKEKGATHIHAHVDGNEESQKKEEQDLLANYPQVYKPAGCNEKEAA